MPRKIRELIRQVESMGFENRKGKGSHRNYKHPKGVKVTISGNPGDDAKPYQEKLVRIAVQEVENEGK